MGDELVRWESLLGVASPRDWALGFVSMLMDISPEMIHSLLPLFMMDVLGVGALTVGWWKTSPKRWP